MKKPKIALVLSGGSSLGFAHVGVLKELLAEGIRPDIVVGTSMGAVVGGAYACGLSLDEMMMYAYKMNFKKFVDINFKPMGIFSGSKITDLLSKVYGDATHEDCICQFAAVACDIISGKEVIMREGKVIDMVRASMNIPGLLVPIERNGMLLVDGGMVNNYPDDIARDMGADIVIGVDVLRESYSCAKPKNAVVALFNSMHLAQNTLYKHKASYSDITITPILRDIDMTNYKKDTIDRAILEGSRECKDRMEEIKAIITNWRRKK